MRYLSRQRGGTLPLFENLGIPERSFGHNNNVLAWLREDEEEVVYCYRLSRANGDCRNCNGQGKINSGSCTSCKGSRVNHDNHFTNFLTTLYPIIRSANSILHEQCLEDYVESTYPVGTKHQKIAVEYSCTAGMGNCDMSAWISDDMMDFIETLTDQDTKNIADAMRKVDGYLLFQKEKTHGFRVFKRSPRHICLEVPGNPYSSLGTTNHSMGMFGDVGTTLYHHSLDTYRAQLCLIVGLITLSDMFEKSKESKEVILG